MRNIVPTQTTAWKNLKKHFQDMQNIHLNDLFRKDKYRFKNFSFFIKDKLLVDISKNRITYTTLKILLSLAQDMHLSEAIQQMFSGKKINCTEDRAVLHTALRNDYHNPIILDGNDIMPEIYAVLKKIKFFSNQVINGQWKGYSGKKITTVVNIGIGGSDLGPSMVTKALKAYKNHLDIKFVSNIDSTELFHLFKIIDFETTIFLISSKTFTTQETIVNAETIKKAFFKKAGCTKHMNQHFFAITMNTNKAKDFGIISDNIFKIWDWVGGRYSIWSAMGLSIALAVGFKNFKELLNGAYAMDMHFKNTTFEKNIPVLLGLIGIWYNNFFYSETEAIFPYDQYLNRFPAYIQQSNMESNGKNVDRNGNTVSWQTGPIIWGEVGTNGQHSFYQLLHQGTKLIPCDFIAPILSHNSIQDHHEILLSNFFAQTHALAFGKSFYNDSSCFFSDIKSVDSAFIQKFKCFLGNRPSNTLLFKKIDPYSLGLLIALYEHKIFTQGVIFNIFSFDQWGVELGKNISNSIYNTLTNKKYELDYDNSTQGLLNFYNSVRHAK
ncbi:glucose-6-phosphate isomerase [Buchnera aphidicola]|uniref:Glucose-6-phosphate isomerase n=1 Tax=Buchnera aphidicola (Sarucallis kahawaluokalani) TaxID=1241878 RepID=A0A4D6Y913_9GAMM|nr:glucose-6-phosphate isomerase [Buchnera aphidicola]QCI26167.1 glucose-6-phosphate isomerase [Buchnera aphidicola (Sarucallis kahawaluokalani)]